MATERPDSTILSADDTYSAITSLIKELEGLPVKLKVPLETKVAIGDLLGLDLTKRESLDYEGLLVLLRDYVKSPDGTVLYAPSKTEEITNLDEDVKIPDWLDDPEHPELKELIWTGAIDNPVWDIRSDEYITQDSHGKPVKNIQLSYERRGRPIRPKDVDSRNLIEDVFSLSEWKVLSQIVKDFSTLQNLIGNEELTEEVDVQKRADAVEQIRTLLHEFNLYRNGQVEEFPATFLDIVKEKIDQIKKRPFGKFELDSADLDQTLELAGKIAAVLSQLFILNHKRGDGRQKIPKPKPWIKETISFELALKDFSMKAARQLALGNDNIEPQGANLVIGEAGVGKNELYEYFAAKTNRPFFLFSCGRGMEAIELINHYEFDTRVGTIKFLTELAEGLQTPGAVVMVDEVNSLPEPVQAILHGVADGNRCLRYDGVTIPLAEGVIVGFGANPASYGAAGDFGQALLNRTEGLGTVMDYPYLKREDLQKKVEQLSSAEAERMFTENHQGEWVCDEALALYQYLPIFQNNPIEDQDFELLWDAICNEQSELWENLEQNPRISPLITTRAGTDISLRNEVVREITSILQILKIVDAWRKNYSTGKGGFLVAPSLRTTISLVKEYANTKDIRKAFLSVFDVYRKNPRKQLQQTLNQLQLLLTNELGEPQNAT